MATWVNLLDIIYPAGSLYISRNSTSPASIVGGTWTQIKGAVLAATGANGFAAQGYGGNLAMTVEQMPSHSHGNPVAVVFNGNATTYRSIFATNSEFWDKDDWNNATAETGGAKLFALPLRSIHLVSNCIISSPLWEVI